MWHEIQFGFAICSKMNPFVLTESANCVKYQMSGRNECVFFSICFSLAVSNSDDKMDQFPMLLLNLVSTIEIEQSKVFCRLFGQRREMSLPIDSQKTKNGQFCRIRSPFIRLSVVIRVIYCSSNVILCVISVHYFWRLSIRKISFSMQNKRHLEKIGWTWRAIDWNVLTFGVFHHHNNDTVDFWFVYSAESISNWAPLKRSLSHKAWAIIFNSAQCAFIHMNFCSWSWPYQA